MEKESNCMGTLSEQCVFMHPQQDAPPLDTSCTLHCLRSCSWLVFHLGNSLRVQESTLSYMHRNTQ